MIAQEIRPMKLSPTFCLHNGAVILRQEPEEVTFGVIDPGNDELCSRLERAYYQHLSESGEPEDPCAIHFRKISQEECRRAVSRLFAAEQPLPPTFSGNYAQEPSVGILDPDNSPAVTLLDSLVSDACAAGATDIHLEGPRVRFRVGGRLKELMVLTAETAEALALRIKNLAHLNTLEKRRAQDGQIAFETYDRSVVLRVSSMPSLDGESLVLRILDPSRIPLDPEQLGFTGEQLQTISRLINHRDGLILVCGPTGSGKSTTQASLLTCLNRETRGIMKIVTIEDPVEYVLPGITQIQVNREIQFDFEEVLRRVFRQDPDVIMFGEIRDSLTASVASSAALTGHLVFATLHTTGAEEALLRLEDLGVGSGILRSILRGVISQRLYEKDGALCLDAQVTAYPRQTSRITGGRDD
jgi:type II secretory ATPase GspE/PulE/Tfp pilus assembly ATPase PilB-like protein